MTSAEFDRRYKQLNKHQKEAVDAIEGPVMVIAGPGTGKTTILTLRIANILRMTDTPPSGILAITFTDAGVKSMKMKLREVIGNRADEVRIHTFHNFASSIINEFKDHFVHLDRTRQMTDIEAESMVRELLEDEKFRDLRPFGNPDFYLSKIISGISDSKREAYSPDMIRDFVKKEKDQLEKAEDSYSTRGKTKGELKAEVKKQIEKCDRTFLFADVYELYERRKKEERKMDFDDLISELLIALKRDELLLRMLQEKFLYILVDEHQDTNDSQNALIKMLADFFDTPNVFIVGDEKQAIYRFQGASVENFLKFQSLWRKMKIIHLEDNYRSHQHILDASFSMIENNYEDEEHSELRVQLKAGSKEKPEPIEIVSGEDTKNTEAYLIKELKNIIEKKPESTVAIITKTNRDLEKVLRLCESNGVAVSSERSIDIFSHPLGSLFFDIAEFLYDPTKTDLLSKTLVAGLWGLSFDDAVGLIKSLKAEKATDIEAKIPVLAKLRKEMTSDGVINFIIRIAEVSGLEALIAREPAYVEVWRGIEELSKQLAREGSLKDPRELLKRLIAYRASSEMKSVKISVGTPDLPIRAMTAHGSKGLEFDYVFIPYATEESWIGRNWGSYFVLPAARTTNDIKDVRRLFYVALTRAKKHVTVLHGSEENGEMLLPLRFIDELSEKDISRVTLTKKSQKDSAFQKSTPNNQAQKTIEYTKHILQTSGLSVTALNHFLECPSQFLYLSILKLPQAPAAAAEKGNAMHLAFSHIWAAKDRSQKNLAKIIIETVESYFEESLLPAFEKKAVKKELFDEVDTIAKELVGHFGQSGTVFAETWSETTFSPLDKGDTRPREWDVPLHGKLDAIIDTGKEAYVYDYKTRQTMSENEIRGNTKNSNGNYFRQLVFYKMLLQNDSRFEDRRIIPSLVFVMPDQKGRCATVSLPVEKADLEKLSFEIQSLLDAVWSGAFLSTFCDDTRCPWCALKRLSID